MSESQVRSRRTFVCPGAWRLWPGLSADDRGGAAGEARYARSLGGHRGSECAIDEDDRRGGCGRREQSFDLAGDPTALSPHAQYNSAMAARHSRRKFLRLGIAGGALLAAGGIFALHGGDYELDDRTRRRLRGFDAQRFRVFEAFADRVLDGCRPGAREVGVALFVDGFVAQMDARTRSDVRKLLGLLEHGTLFGDSVGRFTDLSPVAQDRYLEGWESSRFVVKRTGFSALKSLAMMGYYRDPRAFVAIGYPGPVVPRGFDVYAGRPR